MGTVLMPVFAVLLVYGYMNMIRRFWELGKNTKKAKVKSMIGGTKTIFILILADVWILLKMLRSGGSDLFVPWCIIFVLQTIYIIVLSHNSKYTYICENKIIFADCVKKSEDYSFRINGNILEIQPAKPPKNIERFDIECDIDLLMDVMKNYVPFE